MTIPISFVLKKTLDSIPQIATITSGNNLSYEFICEIAGVKLTDGDTVLRYQKADGHGGSILGHVVDGKFCVVPTQNFYACEGPVRCAFSHSGYDTEIEEEIFISPVFYVNVANLRSIEREPITIDVGVYTALDIDLSEFDFSGVESVIFTIKNQRAPYNTIEHEFTTAEKHTVYVTPDESRGLSHGAKYDFDVLLSSGYRLKNGDNGDIILRNGVGESE